MAVPLSIRTDLAVAVSIRTDLAVAVFIQTDLAVICPFRTTHILIWTVDDIGIKVISVVRSDQSRGIACNGIDVHCR